MTEKGWSSEVRGNVYIMDFEEDMDQSEFGQSAWDEYSEMVERSNITSFVSVVRMDEPFKQETFEVWERSASKAVNEGLTKWGVVAEGMKTLSLKSQIDEPELDIYTCEDREEAIEWARS